MYLTVGLEEQQCLMKELLTKASRLDPGVLLPSTMVELLLRIVKHIYLGEEESMMAYDSAQTPVFGPFGSYEHRFLTSISRSNDQIKLRACCRMMSPHKAQQ